MPKVNIYLPDDLAEAVKAAGVPVSAVCQRALEEAVRRVTAIRETAVEELDLDNPSGGLAHLTERTRTVIRLALERARADGAAEIGTGHLLGGMLDEGTNLALHVLRAMEIEPKRVARELSRHSAAAAAPAGDAGAGRFSRPAGNALELAVTEAIALGHNYIGCEHLLIGLASEPDGTAGRVLRALGAEPRPVRRAVTAALAGYVHLRAQSGPATTAEPAAPAGQTASLGPAAAKMLAAAVREEIRPLAERIERLERHAGLA